MFIAELMELKLLSLTYKDELFTLINTNREHLREWLPWVDLTESPADTESFLEAAINQYQSGQGPQYAIFSDSALCGVCGFHPFDLSNRTGSIGYWLGEAYSGKGIMARAVQALVEQGFREYALNRIEIACATGNTKSRAIPERLGFKLEGVFREREYVNGRYLDQAIYSMLASEFQALTLMLPAKF